MLCLLAPELGSEIPASMGDITLELEKMKVDSAHKELQLKKREVQLKKKKKTGRVVASRLMESTAAHRAKAVGQVRIIRMFKFSSVTWYKSAMW